jgi:hypothetical protein
MGNQTTNKVISLFGSGTDPNETNFYGFGMGTASLRYNVPPGATHRFFAGTTEVLGFNETGFGLNVGSLYLPSPGGLNSAFNYYEEYVLASASITGGSVATTINIKFNRIGSTVHMNVPGFSPGTIATFLSLATGIPSRFRPGTDKHIPIMVIKNTTDIFGSCYIYTGGVFNIYAGVTTATWGGVSGGVPGFTTSWNI